MNICYISNSAAPSKNASSLQIAKLCEGLSKFGHQVTLIKPNTGKSLNYYNFYNIRKKYKIIVIKYFNKFPRGINYYLYSIVSLLIWKAIESEIAKKCTEVPLLAGKSIKDGKATAYICKFGTCLAPVNTPEDLINLLKYKEN